MWSSASFDIAAGYLTATSTSAVRRAAPVQDRRLCTKEIPVDVHAAECRSQVGQQVSDGERMRGAIEQ